MRTRISVLAVLVGSALMIGTALASPGDPFGGDDSGFVPPDAITPSADVLRGLWLQDLEEADVIVAIDDRTVIGSVVARAGGDVA